MNTSNSDRKNRNHADRTPEGRENRLISMALDLAEERLRNGTATAQEVVHFKARFGEKSSRSRETGAREEACGSQDRKPQGSARHGNDV